jgi:hypothetical protein
VSPTSLLGIYTSSSREFWWMNEGWLELRRGRTIDHKWSQCWGRLLEYHSLTLTVTVTVTAKYLQRSLTMKTSRLGGIMVSVPKVRSFKPGRGDGFLRAIKICSTTSFGAEVKPEAPCRKILRFLKISLASVNKNTGYCQVYHSLRPLLLLATSWLCW